MFDIGVDVSHQPAVLSGLREREREWATVIDILK